MIENDTVKLLRECDAGVKMGVSSIDEVLDCVDSDSLKSYLTDSKNEHERLRGQLQSLLDEYHDGGKDPQPMAKGMSWIKTNVMLAVDGSDEIIADLITDGCNMGVKSLNRYLNKYKAADEKSKAVTKKLIGIESQLAVDISAYL